MKLIIPCRYDVSTKLSEFKVSFDKVILYIHQFVHVSDIQRKLQNWGWQLHLMDEV